MSFRGQARRGRPSQRTAQAEGVGGPAPTPPRTPPTPEEAREALLTYAFRALGARALTEAELRTKLARRSDDPELVAEVLARVQDLGYQDDEGVARAEGARRGVGAFRVRQTLKRRGLDDRLIADTLQARDPDAEQESATELLARRWPALSRKRDPRSSAYAFLARRGFPGSVIWAAIREVAAQDAQAIGDEDEPNWAEEPEAED